MDIVYGSGCPCTLMTAYFRKVIEWKKYQNIVKIFRVYKYNYKIII